MSDNITIPPFLFAKSQTSLQIMSILFFSIFSFSIVFLWSGSYNISNSLTGVYFWNFIFLKSVKLRIGEFITNWGNLLFLISDFEPRATLNVIPSDSLIESNGGLVTWANLCEKYFATPPSLSDNALIALPYPIADTFSEPLSNIGSKKNLKDSWLW